MITQKDLMDVIEAVNEIFAGLVKRIEALEEAAAKQSSSTRSKKVEEKA